MAPRAALVAAAALATMAPTQGSVWQGEHLEHALSVEFPAGLEGALAQPGQLPLLPLLRVVRAAAARGGQAGEETEDLPWDPVKIAPQWSAELVYSGEFMGMNFTNGIGRFWYDRPGKRNRMTYTVKTDFFRPNGTFVQDQLTKPSPTAVTQNVTFGAGKDGVCMPFPIQSFGKHLADIFSWTRFAHRAGTKVVGGEPCTVWAFKVPLKGFPISFSACVASDNIPREFNQTVGGGGKFSGNTFLRFSNATAGDPGDEAFETSEACATNYPIPPCDDNKVSAIDIYRIFGPPEPLELKNRNTGDVLGDASFVCTQGSGPAYRSKLITHWVVNVTHSFGQYALCNYNGRSNVCTGHPSMLKHVGRRSSQMQGLGPRLGQCSANEDVGSQYSFPEAAMCPPGVSPGGASGCAWGGAQAVRTVEASCVMEERGLLDACAKDMGHAPFKEAARIWNAAFATNDPKLGGCLDALPRRGTTLVV